MGEKKGLRGLTVFKFFCGYSGFRVQGLFWGFLGLGYLGHFGVKGYLGFRAFGAFRTFRAFRV